MPITFGMMGTGAIGGYVGGRLAAAGEKVVFVGRARLQKEIAEHGLTVVDLDGRPATVAAERVRFETDVAALAECDVVLCCVKSGATPETAEAMRAALGPNAVVVSFQNGVRNPAVLRARLEPTQRVLAGIVNFNVVSKERATFRCATSGPLIVEDLPGAGAGEIGAALRGAGFEVVLAPDIEAIQWSKLTINLNNSISALSDRPTKELILTRGYRRVLAALMEESLEILGAAGIRPARLGAFPLPVIVRVLRMPTPLVRMLARAQLKIDPEARSSMWEDLTTGRPTEVDFINGEVVRLAESCGRSAPRNARVVEIVHEAERAGGGSPRMDAEALTKAVGLS